MKTVFKTIALYLMTFILFSILYIVLSNVKYVFPDQPVFYYRMSLILCLMTGLFIAFIIILSFVNKEFVVYCKDLLLAVVISALINFTFLSLVLVSLDRSISVYLLSYMAANETRSFSADELERIFLEGYMRDYQAIDRRIKEQLVTGSISHEGDGYLITERGKEMVQSWKLIAMLYPVDKRFLYALKAEQ